jgi:hypothetical protein
LGGAPSKATIRRIVIFHIVTGLPFLPSVNNSSRKDVAAKNASTADNHSKRRKINTKCPDSSVDLFVDNHQESDMFELSEEDQLQFMLSLLNDDEELAPCFCGNYHA